jgi:hypothetical protein
MSRLHKQKSLVSGGTSLSIAQLELDLILESNTKLQKAEALLETVTSSGISSLTNSVHPTSRDGLADSVESVVYGPLYMRWIHCAVMLWFLLL